MSRKAMWCFVYYVSVGWYFFIHFIHFIYCSMCGLSWFIAYHAWCFICICQRPPQSM